MALDDKFVSLALKNLQDVLARSGISPEALFTKYDFNGDGSLSYEEFSESLVSITGQRAPQAALKAIFSAIDKDGSGGLDLREIISSFGGQITAPVNEISADSSLEITGHANDEYNGNYKLQNSPLNGQPWFKNTKNPSSAKILYYYNSNSGGSPSWSLDDRIQDGSKDLYRGGWTRALPDGGLPLGTLRWVGIGKVTISISDSQNPVENSTNSREDQDLAEWSNANGEGNVDDDDELYNSKSGGEQLRYLRDNGVKPTNMEELISELDKIKEALIKGVNDNSVTVKEGRNFADTIFMSKIDNLPTPLKTIAKSTWDSQADSIEATLLASAGIAAVGASLIDANSSSESQQMVIPEKLEESSVQKVISDSENIVKNDSENNKYPEEKTESIGQLTSAESSAQEDITEVKNNYTIDQVIEDFSKARFSTEKKIVEEKYKGENFILEVKVISIQRSFGMNLKEEYKGGNTLLAKYGKVDLEILLPNSPEYSEYNKNDEYTINCGISNWNGIRNRLVLLA